VPWTLTIVTRHSDALNVLMKNTLTQLLNNVRIAPSLRLIRVIPDSPKTKWSVTNVIEPSFGIPLETDHVLDATKKLKVF